MQNLRICTAALMISATPIWATTTLSFQGLGDLAGGAYDSRATGVSADGQTVVGSSSSGAGTEAFAWQSGVMTGLGDLPSGSFYSRANAVSADGSVIVGTSNHWWEGGLACRWVRGGDGAYTMSAFYDRQRGPWFGEARGLSPDGLAVVGSSRSLDGKDVPVGWSDGMLVPLGDLSGGLYGGVATAMSANYVVVGHAGVPWFLEGSLPMAFRWTMDSGTMPLFPELLQGGAMEVDIQSCATAISADGSTIVGGKAYGAGWGGGAAWRWTEETGVVTLTSAGHFPEPAFYGCANAVSVDGSVVVGEFEYQAFVWDAENGTRILSRLLADLGIDLEGWTLTSATGVSADGLTIVGNGRNPLGQTEAWIVRIPEPASAVLMLVGMALGLVRIRPNHKKQRATFSSRLS